MYFLVEAVPQRVRFRHVSAELWGGGLLCVIGVGLAVMPSVAPHLIEGQPNGSYLAFAGGAVSLGIGLWLLSRSSAPAGLTIDQQLSVVRFVGGRGDQVDLPFGEFAGFDASQYKKEGSYSDDRYRVKTYYTFDLMKRDGSNIRLIDTTYRWWRDRIATKVTGAVSMTGDHPAPRVDEPGEPFALRKVESRLEVSWRSPVGLFGLVGPLVAAVGLCGLGWALHGVFGGTETGAGSWALTSVFVGVGVLLAGAALYEKLSVVGRINQIELTDSKLRYASERGVVGRTHNWEVALAELRNLIVSLERSELVLHLPPNLEPPKPTSGWSFSWTGQDHERSKRIAMGDVSMAAQLRLEQWLQQEIGSRRGRELV